MAPQEETEPTETNETNTAPAEKSEELKQLETQKGLVVAQKDLIAASNDLIKEQQDLVRNALGASPAEGEGGEPAAGAAAQPVSGETKTPFYATLVSYEALMKNARSIAQGINAVNGVEKIAVVDSMALALDDVGTLQIKVQIAEFKNIFTAHFKECLRIYEQTRSLTLPMKGAGGSDLASLVEGLKVDMDAIRFTVPYAATGLKGLAASGLAGGALMNTLTPLGLAITGVSSVLSGVSNIMGYLREEYALQAVTPAADLEALQAEVAGQITSAKVLLGRFHRVKNSKLLTALQQCLDLRGKIDDIRAKLQLEEAKEADPQLEAVEKPARDLLVSASTSMLTAFDEFHKTITAVSAETKYSPLMIAVIRDSLADLGVTHYLYLKTVAMGGDVIEVKSIWPWRSSQVSVIAGSVCSAVLADAEGNVLFAKTSAPDLVKKRFDCRKFTTA